MKEETKGLYAAIMLSVLIIFAVNYFFPANEPVNSAQEAPIPEVAANTSIANTQDTATLLSADEIVKVEKRVPIKNANLNGSLRLKGARFDYLTLTKYKETLENNSPDIELLYPAGTQNQYFAELGWLSSNQSLKLPTSDTEWKLKGKELTPQSPITLEWDNGQGLRFIRTISVDENYLFDITQTVENNTAEDVVLYPYGLISRSITAESSRQSAVVHEGISSVIDGSLEEIKYKNLKENKPETFEVSEGWAGFSDRYWFTAFIFNGAQKNDLKFANNGNDSYQIDYRGAPLTIASGAAASENLRFFAGAKEIKLLDEYADKANIKKFDLAVDFGWYYFLTKPFFYILTFLYGIIGNMGWAILLFAALLRLAMFPIANKSYDSMSKMKKIQPKIAELQEKYKNDKMLMQQATMDLYRREKINPASGCLPMFIQIPVFFSLYKVLNISIEIRHAPFIGWIKDLSAPDPLTISVWSHIPLPSLLDIGIWPILMGLTMWMQQKLNPAPANKDQARMFALMPLIFTLMLGHFASGLVIYWTLSNVLSILQQRAIMRKNGVK